MKYIIREYGVLQYEYNKSAAIKLAKYVQSLLLPGQQRSIRNLIVLVATKLGDSGGDDHVIQD